MSLPMNYSPSIVRNIISLTVEKNMSMAESEQLRGRPRRVNQEQAMEDDTGLKANWEGEA